MQVWPIPGTATRRLHAFHVGKLLYVHHRETGLYELNKDGLHLVIPSSQLGDGMIFWMEPRREGWLLATSSGLFTFERGLLHPFASEASKFAVGQMLTCALRLPDSRLALGTLNGGIALVNRDGTLDAVLNKESGLYTNVIFSLFVDRENKLWATSNSSIFHLTALSASTIFDDRTALPSQPIQHIRRNHGQITLSTDNDVFGLQADGKRFQLLSGLSGQVKDIMSTPDGLIVAGTHGIKKSSGGKVTDFYTTVQDAFVTKPSHLWPGSILVADGRSIVLLDSQGQSRVLVRNLPDIANSIAEDNTGRLWMGTTSRGVLVAKPQALGPVEAVGADHIAGLPAFSGSALAVASADGRLLVFSSTGSWYLGRAATHFEPVQGYPGREIVAATEIGGDGTLWAAYAETDNRAACIARITMSGNHATWQPHSVEGLWNIGTPHSLLAESSGAKGTVLWIGGSKGLLRNVVANDPVAPQPRAPLLQAFARNTERGALEPITESLPYSTRSVRFEFASAEFALRPALRMETRIDGIDDRWIPADPSSSRELTAVRDGRYVFHVRTVAETGATSEETTFHFRVLPPWWRSVYALIGRAVVFGLGVFGLYRLRVRSLRQRNAELEQKVRQRTEQLEQASAAKTQFVATMSHDIRNPLNGIVGLALALEDTRLDPKQREIVATLRECTTYLSTLVDDVLDFASIEAGRVELRPGPFNPGELLRSIATMLKPDAAVSGATLTVETDPDLSLSLLGDAGRIQQILVNYVANALKYAGGQVRLSATLAADSADEVEFAVTDEGPGISEPEQAVLFTKFTRLPSAQRSEVTGAGLGLASCRLLADLMGGSVGLTSSPGQGARFFLRLPLVAAVAPPEPVKLSVANTSVLLVEDADYNAWAATAVLAKLGLSCERAHTGQEAIQLFTEKRFNLVLLDRNLPDMDGTEVARRIRALEEDGPRAILLAVTAYCTPQDRALCLEAGMDAFVGKPLTPDKLRKILIAAGRRLLTAASLHVAPDAPKPVIDVTLLDYISDGTAQGLETQVTHFLAALTEAEARMAHAAQAQDFDRLGETAHDLLSHAKFVGCSALEAAAISLESATQAQDAVACGELLSRVHREILAVTAAMRRHRPSGQPA